MSSSIVTYGIPGAYPRSTQTLLGSVIGANPTATAIALTCPADSIKSVEEWYLDCDFYNYTITVGPWAQPSPPPAASTGTVDMTQILTFTDTDFDGSTKTAAVTWSGHCQITDTTSLSVCTTKTIGDSTDVSLQDHGPQTSTITSPGPDYNIGMQPITITAGLDKLASVTPSGASASATTTSVSSISTSTHASSSSKTGSSTASSSTAGSSSGTASSAAATATHTGAANVYGVNMGTMGLLGLVAAFLMH
ncbi:hypothetical protein ANO11243_050930 [Dothideomycetidae sp. 11243]|nr:hypothetical protein ANO11243_050930 [fungal sp. No.11243]